MTYNFEETENILKASFTCLILHRDFDLLCRGIANADCWMPLFESKTRHTLILHDPCEQGSIENQEQLLAPFRRHLRGLANVVIQGNIEPSFASTIISEVKRASSEDPSKIIQELRRLKQLSAEYFESGDSKMSSESWVKVCIQIQRLRTGSNWGTYASNKPFVDELCDLMFTLNLDLAQNSLKVMEQSPSDAERVEGIAYSALFVLENAFQEVSEIGGWQPSPLQMAKLWFRKAKVYQLCRDFQEGWEAIGFASTILPDDPMILEEKRHIDSLVS
jgi:hypothetical protein